MASILPRPQYVLEMKVAMFNSPLCMCPVRHGHYSVSGVWRMVKCNNYRFDSVMIIVP